MIFYMQTDNQFPKYKLNNALDIRYFEIFYKGTLEKIA